MSTKERQNNSAANGQPESRLPGLDGLRALSVSLVILVHASYNADFPNVLLLKAIAKHGGFGVEVFFSISGFIITYLLLKEERRIGYFSLKNFYFRRALRIIPPATFYLLVISILAVSGIITLSLAEISASMLFVRNLFTEGSVYTGHYWSLAIEEQFYLIWPFVLLNVRKNARIPLLSAICMGAPLYRQINIWMAGGAANLNWARLDLRYDSILYGALLALLFVEHSYLFHSTWLKRNKQRLVIVASSIIAASFYFESFGGLSRLICIPLRYICVCAVITCVVSRESYLIDRMLNLKLVVWIGSISYSLYLWQQVVFYYPVHGIPFLFIGRVIVALLFASISYYLVERWAMKIRSLVESNYGSVAVKTAITQVIGSNTESKIEKVSI